MLRWLPLFIAGLGLSAGVASGQEIAFPPGVTKELVEEGKVLFLGEGLCHICHGEDGTGARGVGANLTDADWWHSDGSFEAIVQQILMGVTTDEARNAFGARMPPRGGSNLNDNQVRAVAAYVWTLSRAVRSQG